MKRVVLTPELIIEGLRDAKAASVIQLWRDEKIQPVVNRELSIVYARILNQCGLSKELIKKWILWFSGTEKVYFVPNLETSCGEVWRICDELVRIVSADSVVCSDRYGARIAEHAIQSKWVRASDIV